MERLRFSYGFPRHICRRFQATKFPANDCFVISISNSFPFLGQLILDSHENSDKKLKCMIRKIIHMYKSGGIFFEVDIHETWTQALVPRLYGQLIDRSVLLELLQGESNCPEKIFCYFP
jgi:hypothetical protein